MVTIIAVDRRGLPSFQRTFGGGKHFDQQGMAGRLVARMLGRTIATGTGRHLTQKVDFRKEFKVVTGTYRARFHKVLACVSGETGTHEDVENVMHKWLSLGI